MMSVHEMQMVPIGTIRIEVVVLCGAVRWRGGNQTSCYSQASRRRNILNPRFSAFSLALPIELALVTPIVRRPVG
jgi:hypothetical protein